MRAAVLNGVGEALTVQTVPDLTPGPGEAVVRIKTAALNHRDVWIRKGQYAGLKFPIVLGSDGAGVVEAVGADVDPSWVGQEVVVNPALGWGEGEAAQDSKTFQILGLPQDGTFAEQVRVPIDNVFNKPRELSFEQSAALPLAGLTSYRAVVHRGEISFEDTVLVTGAGGGTAVFALQFAVASRTKVYVTSGSAEKIETAKGLGAVDGVNYKSDGWDKSLKQMAGGFDLIIDSAGGENVNKLIEILNPGGRLVTFGATAGNVDGFVMRRIFWKQVSLLGTTMGSPTDFAAMLHFVDQQRIRPLIDRVFPLEKANDALDRMEAGAQMGKIILAVG
ncbi:MAG TPA: zinc-binding dehydrogenase [Fimbriimonas sp.]|nr:zinc-binding dehydrogenase [Fimbriimonas sp.]